MKTAGLSSDVSRLPRCVHITWIFIIKTTCKHQSESIPLVGTERPAALTHTSTVSTDPSTAFMSLTVLCKSCCVGVRVGDEPPCVSLQAHDSPVRAMTWSHNDMWMLTADHGGYVKYWQSNMNNVKMFQAHKEAIREARFIPNLPFSVVNPRLLLLSVLLPVLQYWGVATRGRCSTSSPPPCRPMFLSLINDRCKCVLLQHCIDLLLIFLLLSLSFPVADELLFLHFLNHFFSIHISYVQKRLIFFFSRSC